MALPVIVKPITAVWFSTYVISFRDVGYYYSITFADCASNYVLSLGTVDRIGDTFIVWTWNDELIMRFNASTFGG